MSFEIKFIYSEKATEFCEIFPLHTVKSKGKISQNFVAFSEYMNFKTKSKKMGLWSLQSKIFRSYALITLTCSVKCLTQNCYHIALTLSFLSLALFTALAKFRVFDAFEYQVVQKLQRTPFKSFLHFLNICPFFFLLLEQAKYHSQRAGQREWLFFCKRKVLFCARK